MKSFYLEIYNINSNIKKEAGPECSPKDEPEKIQKKKSSSSKIDTLLTESKDTRDQNI